ncbi:MAG TPA: hypothetical protein VN193_01175 [Candidatus Angelobacter sp.]|jgi:hypothetical protein|nr:hypothetical protein [Candidatus Angelobacter sp.]
MTRVLTQAAALAGAADTGAFLARRRQLFSDAPQRAFGSVGMLGLWLAVAASARSNKRGLTVGLASANAAGQMAMLGVHLRHGIAGPRVWLGAVLGGAALGGAVASR